MMRRIVSEILLTLGVFIALFVVWMFFYTDYSVRGEQEQDIATLQEEFTPEVNVPLLQPVEPSSTGGEVTPPVLEEPQDNTSFALVYIPRFGNENVISVEQGIGLSETLDEGKLGHYPGSAMPGENGNFALAGHRTTYGAVLKKAQELEYGDAIVVQTSQGWYEYKVYEEKIVLPSQVNVVNPVPDENSSVLPTKAVMTLTTCHPQFSAKERYIVHAELSSWRSLEQGPPTSLDEYSQIGE